jgi:hypothetical protein
MKTELYQRMMITLAEIFNEVEFKWSDNQNAFMIMTNGLSLPWSTKNNDFTKEEKLTMLSIIKNSKIFINNGPKWYCITDYFVDMKNEFLSSINYTLTDIENRLNKPIPKVNRDTESL